MPNQTQVMQTQDVHLLDNLFTRHLHDHA